MLNLMLVAAAAAAAGACTISMGDSLSPQRNVCGITCQHSKSH